MDQWHHCFWVVSHAANIDFDTEGYAGWMYCVTKLKYICFIKLEWKAKVHMSILNNKESALCILMMLIHKFLAKHKSYFFTKYGLIHSPY